MLVFPVWNFGFPAILKGFFDRVFLPGVSLPAGGRHGEAEPDQYPQAGGRHDLWRHADARDAGGRPAPPCASTAPIWHVCRPQQDALPRALRHEPGHRRRSGRAFLGQGPQGDGASSECARSSSIATRRKAASTPPSATWCSPKLAAAGAEVRLNDLYARGLRARADGPGMDRLPGLPVNQASLSPQMSSDIRWCDTLIFVYPTWWYGLARHAEGLARPGARARCGLPDARRRNKTIRPGPHAHQAPGRLHHLRGKLVADHASSARRGGAR